MHCTLRSSIMVLVAFLFVSDSVHGEPIAWRELKGDHFFIYYLEDKDFAREVLRKAEAYYDTIAKELGFVRYDNFWTWDQRASIFIYRSHEEYVKHTGRPRWAGGHAQYEERVIVSYKWAESFLESLLPHEMAHIIFREFIGFRNDIPLWLDEGVAQYFEEKKRIEAKALVKRLLSYEHNDVSVRMLNNVDIRYARNSDTVILFYAIAITLVEYLTKEYGSHRFTVFCRQLRDKKSFDEALSFAYPVSVRDTDKLDERWKRYILK